MQTSEKNPEQKDWAAAIKVLKQIGLERIAVDRELLDLGRNTERVEEQQPLAVAGAPAG